MAVRIGRGYFENEARRRARNALIRNTVFVLVLAGSMSLWLTRPAAGTLAEERPWVVSIEGLLALLAVWRIAVAVSRLRDVTKHPVLRDFASHGDARTVAAEVEEAVVSGSARCLGDVICTSRFIVTLGFSHNVVRIDDIAWVYPKRLKLSVNFIPVGEIRTLEIFTYGSDHRWVSVSLDADAEVLETIRASAPEARFGYTAANEKWWRDTRTRLPRRPQLDPA